MFRFRVFNRLLSPEPEAAFDEDNWVSLVFSSLRLLSDLLNVRPEYCAVVHAIVISDSLIPSDEQERPGVLTWDILVDGIDSVVAKMLTRLPNLRSFTWLLSAAARTSFAHRTIQQLKNMPSLLAMSLYAVSASQDAKATSAVASIEYLAIRYRGPSPYWSLPYIQSNAHLCALHLDGIPETDDPTWMAALCNAAACWRNLCTLTVTGTLLKDFRLVIQHCAVRCPSVFTTHIC